MNELKILLIGCGKMGSSLLEGIVKSDNFHGIVDVIEPVMQDSLKELDGVFTYLVATKDSLGMAKDTMAAKPMVLYESDDLIALGSEEIFSSIVAAPCSLDFWKTPVASLGLKRGILFFVLKFA